ncbi:MAG: Gfo/Idh/MocA family protein [Lachnospiraceae bacterium]
MKKIRIVIIGFGNMGKKYSEYLLHGDIEGMELAGICCRNQPGQQYIRANYPDSVKVYQNTKELFAHSDEIDSVLIAVPHKQHVAIAIEAFRHNLHVLCEKPAGISVGEVELLNQMAARSSKSFAMIFPQRAMQIYQKLKAMLTANELGNIYRIVWVCNQHYLTQAYHNSAPWRSSWLEEGGGLLLNPCHHMLDLWQHFFGMPDTMRAYVDFGKYNNFTVDDSFTLLFFYQDGARGIMTGASGEYPGVNRLEIFADNGTVCVEEDKLTFRRANVPVAEFARTNQEYSGRPGYETIEYSFADDGDPYIRIIQNFRNNIVDGEPLLAPGEEGLNAMELANGAYFSALKEQATSFPIDAQEYERLLDKCQEEEWRMGER